MGKPPPPGTGDFALANGPSTPLDRWGAQRDPNAPQPLSPSNNANPGATWAETVSGIDGTNRAPGGQVLADAMRRHEIERHETVIADAERAIAEARAELARLRK